MVLMERPVMDHLVDSPDAEDVWGLKASFRSRIYTLIRLDYKSWRKQFADDGFTESQVEQLDTIVDEWARQIDMDALLAGLQSIRCLDNNVEIERTVGDWMKKIPKAEVARRIAYARFPNLTHAVCYAAGRVGRLAENAVEFEKLQRGRAEEPECSRAYTPEQIERGKALAEAGLHEDVKIWPRS